MALPKQSRIRSRLGPVDLAEHFAEQTGPNTRSDPKLFQRGGHMRTHASKRMIYTSAEDFTVGTPLVVPRAMRIIAAQASVSGAPSGGTFECDLILDGTGSLYGSITTIDIEDGELVSVRFYPDNVTHIPAGGSLTVEIYDDAGATGPLVLHIDYLDEGA